MIGIVYVCRIRGTNVYKVGRTRNNVAYRINEIRSTHPAMSGFEHRRVCRGMEFVDAVLADNDSELELLAHRFLSPHLYNGYEWFKLSPRSLCELSALLRARGTPVGPDWPKIGLRHCPIWRALHTAEAAEKMAA